MEELCWGQIVRPTHKTQAEINKEWDSIAELRAKQIESGKDLSYCHVLVPLILELCSECDLASVIDVGCGVGFLSREFDRHAGQVVGVDGSLESIEIARRLHGENTKLRFVNSTIEEFARSFGMPAFTLAVCNMMFLTSLDLDKTLQSIAGLLCPGGHLVFTIAHPCFWPIYWGYDSQDWFEYKKEIQIEAVFRISLETCREHKTTHIHRPLEQYTEELRKTGFLIEAVCEPVPPPDIQAKYPRLWDYPRFLGLRCVRR